MSFTLESIVELILTGVIHATENRTIPKFVRYALLTVTYLLLGMFLIDNGIKIDHNIIKTLLWFLLVVVTVYYFYLLKEIRRSRT